MADGSKSDESGSTSARAGENGLDRAASKVFATSVAATMARLQLYKNHGADGSKSDESGSTSTRSAGERLDRAASKELATSVAATMARLQLYKNHGADGSKSDESGSASGRRERPRPRCLQGIRDERRRDDGAAPALQEPRGGRQQVRRKRQHVRRPARTASTALPPRYSRRASPRRWRGSSSTRTTGRTAASPTKAPARPPAGENGLDRAASKVFATSVAATMARLQLYKNYGADGLYADAFDSETTKGAAKAELDLNKYQAGGVHALHAIEQVSYVQSETMVYVQGTIKHVVRYAPNPMSSASAKATSDLEVRGQAHEQTAEGCTGAIPRRASSGGLRRRARTSRARRRRLGRASAESRRRARHHIDVGGLERDQVGLRRRRVGPEQPRLGPRQVSCDVGQNFLCVSVGFRST